MAPGAPSKQEIYLKLRQKYFATEGDSMAVLDSERVSLDEDMQCHWLV